jgi:hypothetical protein
MSLANELSCEFAAAVLTSTELKLTRTELAEIISNFQRALRNLNAEEKARRHYSFMTKCYIRESLSKN